MTTAKKGLFGYIDDIKSMSRFYFRRESKKQCIQRKLNEFYSLIDARSFVTQELIFEVAGIENKTYITKSTRGNECKIQLSYLQLYNLLVKYAITGRMLKQPWKVTNEERLFVVELND